jgi:hypothetical protein
LPSPEKELFIYYLNEPLSAWFLSEIGVRKWELENLGISLFFYLKLLEKFNFSSPLTGLNWDFSLFIFGKFSLSLWWGVDLESGNNIFWVKAFPNLISNV